MLRTWGLWSGRGGRDGSVVRFGPVDGTGVAAGGAIALDFAVHDRWEIPRELLMEEPPAARQPDRKPSLVAEWLGKRHIRNAPHGTAAWYRDASGRRARWTRLQQKRPQSRIVVKVLFEQTMKRVPETPSFFAQFHKVPRFLALLKRLTH